MKKELYIIGAGSVGGHIALNVKDYSSGYTIAGFYDDDLEKLGTKQFGYEVLGTVDEVLKLNKTNIVIGIAFPRIKKKLIQTLLSNPLLEYPTLIHEKAWISQDVSIGRGCIIYPGTTINFGSKINDFVVLNMNCALGHHTVAGMYSSFAPGVCTGGHSIIEEEVDMGIGATTLQDIRVGVGSTIGGQSMVTKNVNPDSTVAGVPARTLVSNKTAEAQ